MYYFSVGDKKNSNILNILTNFVHLNKFHVDIIANSSKLATFFTVFISFSSMRWKREFIHHSRKLSFTVIDTNDRECRTKCSFTQRFLFQRIKLARYNYGKWNVPGLIGAVHCHHCLKHKQKRDNNLSTSSRRYIFNWCFYSVEYFNYSKNVPYKWNLKSYSFVHLQNGTHSIKLNAY